jgi:hypothetical protein
MKRTRWAALLLVALVAITGALAAPARAFDLYPKLDAVASWLAMRPVHIRCLDEEETAQDPIIQFYGASAYVEGREGPPWGRWRPKDYSTFAFPICEPLLHMVRGNYDAYPRDELAWSILVLAHESGHLRGHRWATSEALTQRWALRHFVYTAIQLGAEEPLARELLRSAVFWHRKLDDEYKAHGCKKPWVNASGHLQNCRVPQNTKER